MPRFEDFEPVRILGVDEKRCAHIADDLFHVCVRVSQTSSVRWHKFFDEALVQDPTKKWRCEGEEVIVECTPSDLQHEVDRLKAQIETTNRRYVDYIEEQRRIEEEREAEERRHNNELLSAIRELKF